MGSDRTGPAPRTRRSAHNPTIQSSTDPLTRKEVRTLAQMLLVHSALKAAADSAKEMRGVLVAFWKTAFPAVGAVGPDVEVGNAIRYVGACP